MSSQVQRPEIRYDVRYCTFAGKAVWAVLTQQPGRRWTAVNCLDKHDACNPLNCRFISERGAWPFSEAPGSA